MPQRAKPPQPGPTTDIILTAEVTFRADGPTQLHFPLTQPLRLSLWPAANPLSAPAELLIQEPVPAGVTCVLRIYTLLLSGLAAEMQPGAVIRFGAPPTRIVAEGRIISIEPARRGPAAWVRPKMPNGLI